MPIPNRARHNLYKGKRPTLVGMRFNYSDVREIVHDIVESDSRPSDLSYIKNDVLMRLRNKSRKANQEKLKALIEYAESQILG